MRKQYDTYVHAKLCVLYHDIDYIKVEYSNVVTIKHEHYRYTLDLGFYRSIVFLLTMLAVVLTGVSYIIAVAFLIGVVMMYRHSVKKLKHKFILYSLKEIKYESNSPWAEKTGAMY